MPVKPTTFIAIPRSKKGYKQDYLAVMDKHCLGRHCFDPARIRVEKPILLRKRGSTSQLIGVCRRGRNHGFNCPIEENEDMRFSAKLEERRKNAGYEIKYI